MSKTAGWILAAIVVGSAGIAVLGGKHMAAAPAPPTMTATATLSVGNHGTSDPTPGGTPDPGNPTSDPTSAGSNTPGSDPSAPASGGTGGDLTQEQYAEAMQAAITAATAFTTQNPGEDRPGRVEPLTVPGSAARFTDGPVNDSTATTRPIQVAWVQPFVPTDDAPVGVTVAMTFQASYGPKDVSTFVEGTATYRMTLASVDGAWLVASAALESAGA